MKKHSMFNKNHYGKWVAVSSTKKEVIGYSKDLASLAKRVGTKNVTYTKPLDPSKKYAF